MGKLWIIVQTYFRVKIRNGEKERAVDMSNMQQLREKGKSI